MISIRASAHRTGLAAAERLPYRYARQALLAVVLVCSVACHRSTPADRLQRRLIGTWDEHADPFGVVMGAIHPIILEFVPDGTIIMSQGKDRITGRFRALDSLRIAVTLTGMASLGGEQILGISWPASDTLRVTGLSEQPHEFTRMRPLRK